MAAPLEYLLNTLMAVALEKSILVIHKILRLLVNTLTADDKHYLPDRNNLAQPIQIRLSEKQKIFSEFFLKFLKSVLDCQRKMALIADVFREISSPKNTG